MTIKQATKKGEKVENPNKDGLEKGALVSVDDYNKVIATKRKAAKAKALKAK